MNDRSIFLPLLLIFAFIFTFESLYCAASNEDVAESEKVFQQVVEKRKKEILQKHAGQKECARRAREEQKEKLRLTRASRKGEGGHSEGQSKLALEASRSAAGPMLKNSQEDEKDVEDKKEGAQENKGDFLPGFLKKAWQGIKWLGYGEKEDRKKEWLDNLLIRKVLSCDFGNKKVSEFLPHSIFNRDFLFKLMGTQGLSEGDVTFYQNSWGSPDGKMVIVSKDKRSGDQRIFTVPCFNGGPVSVSADGESVARLQFGDFGAEDPLATLKIWKSMPLPPAKYFQNEAEKDNRTEEVMNLLSIAESIAGFPESRLEKMRSLLLVGVTGEIVTTDDATYAEQFVRGERETPVYQAIREAADYLNFPRYRLAKMRSLLEKVQMGESEDGSILAEVQEELQQGKIEAAQNW